MARTTKFDIGEKQTRATGEFNRELVGFSADFKPEVGTPISSAGNSMASLLGGTGEGSALSILNKTNDLLFSSEALEDLWTWSESKTFKIGIPTEVKSFVQTVSSVLEDLVSALKVMQTILETLKLLVQALEDALKLLLDAILSKLEGLLDFFSVDAKARLLLVPPIMPPRQENAFSPSAIDQMIFHEFYDLVDSVYEDQTLPGNLSKEKLKNRMLGYSANSRNLTGSAGLLDVINTSFEDTKDFNRPTESLGYTGGLLVQAGFPSATQVLDTWDLLCKIFVSGKDDFLNLDPISSPASLSIDEFKFSGYLTDTTAQAFIRIGDPSDSFTSPLLIPSPTRYVARIWYLYIVEDTSGDPDPAVRQAGFISLDKFNTNTFTDLAPVDTIGEIDLTLAFSDLVSVSRNLEVTKVSNGGSLVPGKSYLAKVAATYYQYKLVNGSYIQSDIIVEKVSKAKKLAIPFNANRSAFPMLSYGLEPNWIKYGKEWSIPGLDDLRRYIKEFIEMLKSWVGTAGSIIQQILDTYILAVSKLTGMLQTVLNLVYVIEKLLALEVGGTFTMFASEGGAAGLKKVINDHFDKHKAGWDAETAKNNAYLSALSLQASDSSVVLPTDTGNTSKYDWYGSDESVCGLVLAFTSESVEELTRLFSVLSLLFGNEGAPTTADLSVNTALTKTADIASGINSTLSAGLSTSLFSSSLSSLTSTDHDLSPENICD